MTRRHKAATISLLLIVAFSFFPLIGIVMAGPGDNEGNSAWGVLPWMIFYTLPLGVAAFTAWTGVMLWTSGKPSEPDGP